MASKSKSASPPSASYEEDDVRNRILDALRAEGGPLPVRTVASIIGIPASKVRSAMQMMKEAGLLIGVPFRGFTVSSGADESPLTAEKSSDTATSNSRGLAGSQLPNREYHFDARELDRTIITAPLREAMESLARQEDVSEHYCVQDGLLSVIIDLNHNHPGGRMGARERVLDLLVRVAFDGKRHGVLSQVLHRGLREASQQYVFAWLTPEQIKFLVALDADRSSTRATAAAIFRVWPDHKLEPFNSRSLLTIKADAARSTFSCSGRGIVWAVVDSGIDSSHPMFALHRNLAELPSGVEHRDFTGAVQPSPLTDVYGHGTHVAGIVSGEWKAPEGIQESTTVYERDVNDQPLTLEAPVTYLSGVAPESKLVSYKVLDDRGKGGVTNVIGALEDILRVNVFGKQLRIHGVNLSLGYPFNPRWFACGHSPLCEVVNRLSRAGVFVVAAAGNTGYGYGDTVMAGTWAQGLPMSINDPGNAERAITVGSTHRDAPHTYGVSYFSSKGPTGDGRMKPDLLAPGEKIVSAFSHQASNPMKTLFKEDSGTSMAAPHVSGAIAAFLSVRGEFIGRTDEVKAVLKKSAIDLQREPSLQGAGLLDLFAALQAV